MEEGAIHANLVIELLGKPVEHLKEAIQTHVTKLGSEKGIKILNKTYHDPVLAEDSKTMYTTFAEIELEFASIENYLGVIFAYLPSHIEILNPEKLTLSNIDLSDIGTQVLQRIHGYDAVVKNILQERENLLVIFQKDAPSLYKKLTTPPEEAKKPNKSSLGKESKKKLNSKKKITNKKEKKV
jgi:hypothetical protein